MSTQHLEEHGGRNHPGFKDTKDRYVIRLPKPQWFTDLGISTIPGYVWQEPKFRFNPQDFMIEDARLKTKLISSEVQVNSYEKFLDNPFQAGVYGVGAEPTDSVALYFAAYLAYTYAYAKTQGGADFRLKGHVHWESLTGGFRNRLIYEDGSINENIGLLVLSNVAENSTQVKIEKLRDTLVAYAKIPRIVVVGGEDPISFFSTKLHHKITGMFFNSGSLANRKNEVV